jgi:hypothetical protein
MRALRTLVKAHLFNYDHDTCFSKEKIAFINNSLVYTQEFIMIVYSLLDM